MQRAATHLADHLHEVPVLLFVAGWMRRGESQLQALMPAVQNILLACRAVGLGASLTTLHRSFGDECDRWLGLPDNRPTCALIPIGWPLGRYGRPPRRSVDECLSWERYKAPVIGGKPRENSA
jgi:nitroreductase